MSFRHRAAAPILLLALATCGTYVNEGDPALLAMTEDQLRRDWPTGTTTREQVVARFGACDRHGPGERWCSYRYFRGWRSDCRSSVVYRCPDTPGSREEASVTFYFDGNDRLMRLEAWSTAHPRPMLGPRADATKAPAFA